MALGPCGCDDYHLADCPIRTASISEDPPEPQDPWTEMDYDFLRDDVDLEDEWDT